MIKYIATHRRPDGDELLSIWLIKAFAKQAEGCFPGSTSAEITSFTEDMLPDGMNVTDFPHMLFIGCGKGELDEHPRKDQNQCAATRVAVKLGVRQNTELCRLLQMTLGEDRDRSKVQNSFGDGLKVVSHHFIEDPKKTFEWAQVAYNAIYAHDQKVGKKLDPTVQLTVFEVKRMIQGNVGGGVADRWMKVYSDATSARDKRKNEARKILGNTPIYDYVTGGKEITLAVVKSDNDQINYIGWSQFKIGVLVQQTTNGNVQIYTRQDLGLCLRHAAELIRRKEIEMMNLDIQKENKETERRNVLLDAAGKKTLPLKTAIETPCASRLRSTDTISEAPQWHLMNTKGPNKPILFNGNQITATEVLPTRIHIDEIVRFVEIGLEMIPSDQAHNLVNVGDAIPAP